MSEAAFVNDARVMSKGQVTIPKNVQAIGKNCFTALEITEYRVEEENSEYASPMGLLTDKAERVLLSCPTRKDGLVELPDSIFEIRANSFAWCRKVSGIVIPETTAVIRPYAFSDRIYADQEEKIMLYCEKDSPAALWAAENDWPWTETDGQQ